MGKKLFGSIDGKDVYQYTLKNEHVEVCVIDYGATITNLFFNDKNGEKTDLVLGYDTFDEYLKNSNYIGVTVGRFANRIGGASFAIDGTKYQLTANEGKNTLHSGKKGFDKQKWNVTDYNDDSIVFTITSPDGEDGFPGTVSVEHSMKLNGSSLVLEYKATTDKTTHVSLTNHSYFNLKGTGNGLITDHIIQVNTPFYTEVDDESIPTGKIIDGKGSFFDLTTPVIVKDQFEKFNQSSYDYNYALKNEGKFIVAAMASSSQSGIELSVETDSPGIQFYSGSWLNGPKGKNGAVYERYAGFCLETQHYPDAPNKPEFPSSLLKPGDEYNTKTVYSFRVK